MAREHCNQSPNGQKYRRAKRSIDTLVVSKAIQRKIRTNFLDSIVSCLWIGQTPWLSRSTRYWTGVIMRQAPTGLSTGHSAGYSASCRSGASRALFDERLGGKLDQQILANLSKHEH